MKITSFALALDIIIRFDRAVADFPPRPTFTTPNDDQDASASVFASASSVSAMNFTAMTKEELVDNFISRDGEVEFSNITASPHYRNCTRFFTGGYNMGFAYENDDTNTTLTDIHLLPNEGIMLSSGNPLHFEWNDNDAQTTGWGWDLGLGDIPDADLANVTNTTWGDYTFGIFDACFIEFDFKCSNQASTPTVSFKYMFGSDEYNEYVNSAYNDAFALILNGENIAKLPTSESNTDVVSINNVNYEVNKEYFHTNDPSDGSIYPQLEPDGFTVVLTAVGTPLQDPNEMNTIKIALGDVGDAALDSWVLLESGTFSCVDIDIDPCSKKSSKSSKSGYSSKSSKGCYSSKSSKRTKSTKYSKTNLLAQEMTSGASLVFNFNSAVVGFGVSIFVFLVLAFDPLI